MLTRRGVACFTCPRGQTVRQGHRIRWFRCADGFPSRRRAGARWRDGRGRGQWSRLLNKQGAGIWLQEHTRWRPRKWRDSQPSGPCMTATNLSAARNCANRRMVDREPGCPFRRQRRLEAQLASQRGSAGKLAVQYSWASFAGNTFSWSGPSGMMTKALLSVTGAPWYPTTTLPVCAA